MNLAVKIGVIAVTALTFAPLEGTAVNPTMAQAKEFKKHAAKKHTYKISKKVLQNGGLTKKADGLSFKLTKKMLKTKYGLKAYNSDVKFNYAVKSIATKGSKLTIKGVTADDFDTYKVTITFTKRGKNSYSVKGYFTQGMRIGSATGLKHIANKK